MMSIDNNSEAENNPYRQTDRWHGIDFCKGILIILVFVGHLVPGELRNTFIRYTIYQFHMPLFIALSGFLFDVEKKSQNPINVLNGCWQRFENGNSTSIPKQELVDLMISSYKLSPHKLMNNNALHIVCRRSRDFSMDKVS